MMSFNIGAIRKIIVGISSQAGYSRIEYPRIGNNIIFIAIYVASNAVKGKLYVKRKISSF